MATYVLDANALMARLEGRAGAGMVEDILLSAAKAQCKLLLSLINWGEVYYSVWKSKGEQRAEATLRNINQLPIELMTPDREITKLAAALKARHGLPYADCFAAALAQQYSANLVTADADFRAVEKLIAVVWLA